MASLAIVAAAVLATWPSAAALGCDGMALDDGCLFTVTGGDTPNPDDGYAVTNADGVPLWDFVQERDLQAIGYPISQRWTSGPFTLQAFQKVILQWDPGPRRMNYYNTLDVLANRYPDVELPNVPAHLVLEADRGADFATITRNHLLLLDRNPAIRERFLSEPDWLNLFGLPIRYEEREAGGHSRGLQMLRAQRAVFVLWNVPAPGTTVGRVNLQNVSDKVKQLSNVIIPNAAKLPVTGDEAAWLPRYTLAPRSATPLTARAALVAFYHATGGSMWTHSTGWLTDAPLGAWHGVATDDTGRVTELRLPDNQLRGAIPPELSSLAHLTALDLRENHLIGEIPPGLGRLSRLWTLWLPDNRLRGAIPPDLRRLTNLAWLRLENNQLGGEIPSELGDLASLELLELQDNRLSGTIPPALARLERLRLLQVSGNRLQGEIPPALGRLGRLTDLWLGYNELSGEIPAELGRLGNLRRLFLVGNRLSGPIPSALGRLGKLQNLWLAANRLSGAIPPDLGRLARLEELSIYDNQLSGVIPPELRSLTSLNSLWLGGTNRFTGCIPEGLQNVRSNDLGTLGLPSC